MDRNELNHRLPQVVSSIVQSVNALSRLQHLDRVYLPNRDVIVDAIGKLREIIYPGYLGKQGLTTENLPFRLGESIIELSDMLFDQVRCCLRYKEHIPGTDGDPSDCEDCDREAAK